MGGTAMSSPRIRAQWVAAVFLAASFVFQPQAAWAHHGWGWATDEEFEISGRIVNVRLGNPHGEVTIETKDGLWVVEVGQPWRNMSAGLFDSLFAKGVLITVHGHRSARPDERLVKAERVVINGRSYNLYPDRES
jgi:hypothetical protein